MTYSEAEWQTKCLPRSRHIDFSFLFPNQPFLLFKELEFIWKENPSNDVANGIHLFIESATAIQ